MASNTQGTNATKYVTCQTHYLRQDIAYNSAGLSAGTFKIGTLPAGAIVEKVQVKVTTAFNAASSNALDVGVSGNDDSLVDATDTDVDLTATGSSFVWRGADETFAADTPVYAKYTQTGDAATAGAATVIVFFTVDNG